MLVYVIRLKSKDALYKHYTLGKKMFLQGNGSANLEPLDVYTKVDEVGKHNTDKSQIFSEKEVTNLEKRRLATTSCWNLKQQYELIF